MPKMEIAAEDVAVVDAADLLGAAETVTYPHKTGRGWTTSDGYRYFNEEKAVAHQSRVGEQQEDEDE